MFTAVAEASGTHHDNMLRYGNNESAKSNPTLIAANAALERRGDFDYAALGEPVANVTPLHAMGELVANVAPLAFHAAALALFGTEAKMTSRFRILTVHRSVWMLRRSGRSCWCANLQQQQQQIPPTPPVPFSGGRTVKKTREGPCLLVGWARHMF